jgi:hypothetical protein
MANTIFDPQQYNMTFAGIPITGYADGEFATIAQEADNFGDVVGSDGLVARSKSNDRRATITFKLLQTSPTNKALSALANGDLLNPNGAGVGALRIADLFGETQFTADQCWISKPPDVSLDRTATAREWTLRCADLTRLDAGAGTVF